MPPSRSGPTDTSPAVEALLIEAHRRMTPREKMRRVLDCNAAAEAMARAGLLARHGPLPERELRLRLAVLRLGEDLVRRALGWDPRAADG